MQQLPHSYTWYLQKQATFTLMMTGIVDRILGTRDPIHSWKNSNDMIVKQVMVLELYRKRKMGRMKKMLSGSIKEVYIEMNTGSNHKLNDYLEKNFVN